MPKVTPIRVYHVDGNAECLDATRELLAPYGFEISSQQSGAWAYGEIMTPGRINADVAIIDYSVRPDGFRTGEDNHLVTGIDLIDFIANFHFNGPRILSTSTTGRDVQDNSEIYLRKPFGPEPLVNAVKKLAALNKLRNFYSHEDFYKEIRILAKQVNGVPRLGW